jgi:hypothetical protein
VPWLKPSSNITQAGVIDSSETCRYSRSNAAGKLGDRQALQLALEEVLHRQRPPAVAGGNDDLVDAMLLGQRHERLLRAQRQDHRRRNVMIGGRRQRHVTDDQIVAIALGELRELGDAWPGAQHEHPRPERNHVPFVEREADCRDADENRESGNGKPCGSMVTDGGSLVTNENQRDDQHPRRDDAQTHRLQVSPLLAAVEPHRVHHDEHSEHERDRRQQRMRAVGGGGERKIERETQANGEHEDKRLQAHDQDQLG